MAYSASANRGEGPFRLEMLINIRAMWINIGAMWINIRAMWINIEGMLINIGAMLIQFGGMFTYIKDMLICFGKAFTRHDLDLQVRQSGLYMVRITAKDGSQGVQRLVVE